MSRGLDQRQGGMATISASCTQTVGRCLSEEQARIAKLDSQCICTGALTVSGCASLVCATATQVSVGGLTAESILGTPSIPSALLGTSTYSSSPGAVLLNGQQLQASVYSTPGAVPLDLASGSVILMGLPLGAPSYVLDWQCNMGTSYYFINVGAAPATLGLSATGTINASTGTAATYTVPANQRGVVFKYGPTQWAVIVQ